MATHKKISCRAGYGPINPSRWVGVTLTLTPLHPTTYPLPGVETGSELNAPAGEGASACELRGAFTAPIRLPFTL